MKDPKLPDDTLLTPEELAEEREFHWLTTEWNYGEKDIDRLEVIYESWEENT